MAAEVAVAREAAPTTKPVAAPVDENIPEIIEERRKDAEGRVLAYRYARGKLLGKVSPMHQCMLPAVPRARLPAVSNLSSSPTSPTGRLRKVLSGHLAAIADAICAQDCGQELVSQA